MTIITETKELSRLAKQTRAVRDYLEQHGSITAHFAIYHGIPGYGPVLRLGARIWDLRDVGMKIVTTEEDGTTKYTLEREKKETAPTLEGFGKYLKKIRVSQWDLLPEQLAEHYREYCADIARGV